ncbi:hypothetical protein KAI04_04450 [Candidatus Pacearchaeota archaeon]|nr:hypothetical protein [Candidatus Pacearchaeota archaeon]
MKKIIIFSLIAISVILIGTLGYLSYSDFEEHEHGDEHSVEIEGKEVKDLTVQQVADLWEINSEILLFKIVNEFELEVSYTTNTVLDVIRDEYAFSPALIKDMAEEIKQENLQNE